MSQTKLLGTPKRLLSKVMLQCDYDSLVFQAPVYFGAEINSMGFQMAKRLKLHQEELPQALSASALDGRLSLKVTRQ